MRKMVRMLQNEENAKTIRQLTSSPMRVPSGTPMRLARVMPITIIEMAVVLLLLSASLSATMLPTPKNAPWGSPDMNLESMAT